MEENSFTIFLQYAKCNSIRPKNENGKAIFRFGFGFFFLHKTSSFLLESNNKIFFKKNNISLPSPFNLSLFIHSYYYLLFPTQINSSQQKTAFRYLCLQSIYCESNSIIIYFTTTTITTPKKTYYLRASQRHSASLSKRRFAKGGKERTLNTRQSHLHTHKHV